MSNMMTDFMFIFSNISVIKSLSNKYLLTIELLIIIIESLNDSQLSNLKIFHPTKHTSNETFHAVGVSLGIYNFTVKFPVYSSNVFICHRNVLLAFVRLYIFCLS